MALRNWWDAPSQSWDTSSQSWDALPVPQPAGPQSDDPVYTIAGSAIHTSYVPADATFLPAGINAGATTSTTSPTGVTTTVSGSTATVTAGGIVINLIYD